MNSQKAIFGGSQIANENPRINNSEITQEKRVTVGTINQAESITPPQVQNIVQFNFVNHESSSDVKRGNKERIRGGTFLSQKMIQP